MGLPMPAIIDEATWYKAQERRENARGVPREPRGWLLRGMCVCGQCGHTLKCMQKRPGMPRYYVCRGRISRRQFEGGERCSLPYIGGDQLEWPVEEAGGISTQMSTRY